MTPVQFIAKLGLHFRHQTDDADAQREWMRDAVEAISGTAPNILEAASKAIIRDRESPWFPTIGECVQACRLAAAKIMPAPTIRESDEKWPEPTAEQKAAVNAMVANLKLAINSKVIPADRGDSAPNYDPHEPKPLPDVSRPAFEKMMRESPNQELYLDKKTLTERSRRMMGDDQ